MAHLHEVRDSDTHFIIDPITRVITNTAAAKNKLMQGDHNSEIFTFEIPKTVEFHDMNLCNKVEIHYINVAADKTGTSVDVYDVQDFGAAEDDINAYAFSWRISDNATKYAGTLNFRIRFACTDGQGNYTYRWHTDIFKGITIADGFDNAPIVIADYSDVLEQWKKDLQNLVTDEKINELVTDYLERNPVEVPEALPNPHALTLTGAVEAEYDGSEALSVEIPEGAGDWKLIGEYELGLSNAERVIIKFDSFNETEFIVLADFPLTEGYEGKLTIKASGCSAVCATTVAQHRQQASGQIWKNTADGAIYGIINANTGYTTTQGFIFPHWRHLVEYSEIVVEMYPYAAAGEAPKGTVKLYGR